MFGFFKRPATERAQPVDAFAAAEAMSFNPPLGTLYLLGACASPDAAAAERAGRELARRLGEVSLDRLAWYDDEMRRTFGGASHARLEPALPRWLFERDAVARLRLSGEAALPALALLSMHRSGFVREDAVAALAAQEGDALPYLLLRANDWVEPIRLRVWHALNARLEPRFAAAWVASLPLLVRLLDARRDDHRVLVSRIRTELGGNAENRPALMAGLASPDRRVRRICFDILTSCLKSGEAVRIGLANRDPVVRLRAARAAEALDRAEFAALVPLMLLDRFVAVRTLGVIFAERAGEVALLRAAALDAAATPRGIAASGLARRGIDVAALYRAAVEADGEVRLGVVAGLGERGAAGDAETVVRFLGDRRARVREAALVAYARLASAEAAPVLARMLEDAAPSVSRAAMRQLEERRFWLDPATLEALYAPANPRHVRVHALRLMSRHGRWAGIVPILRALCDGDARIVAAAERLLGRWLHLQRSAHAPASVEEHARFLDALHQYGRCVGDPFLAAQLRVFR